MPDLLKERINRLDSIPTRFTNLVEGSQAEIFKELIGKMKSLDLGPKGEILLNSNNLAMIEELKKELQKIIENPDGKYIKSVVDFVKEFDKQKDINKAFFKDGFDFTNDADFDALYKNSQQQAVDLLAKSAVEQNVAAYGDMLQTAIGSSDSYGDLIGNIQTQIMGNSEIDGGMVKYARQNAKDIYAVADRQYVKAVSESLEVQFWKYSGGLIDTSREFCISRNGKTYHKKEIEGWADLGDWDGRAKGTTNKTVFSLLGGYGCDHVLVPLALKYVEKDVLSRAISKGYIKKSDLPPEIQSKL